MKEYFQIVWEFLFNPKIKGLNKLLVIAGVLFLVLWANDYFGFTYYYSSNRKIDQLKEISTLLRDSSNLTPPAKQYLLQQENNTIYRKDFLTRIITNRSDTAHATASFEEWKAEMYRRNNFWNILTSNFVYLVLLFFFLPTLIGNLPREMTPQSALAMLGFIALTFGMIEATSRLTAQIPIIRHNLYYNYGLNILISGIIPGLSFLGFKLGKARLRRKEAEKQQIMQAEDGLRQQQNLKSHP